MAPKARVSGAHIGETSARVSARAKSPGRSPARRKAMGPSSPRSPPAAKADHQGAPRSLDAYIERGSIATANAFVGAMVVLMLTHSMGTLGNFFRLTFCVQFAAYVVAATLCTESFYDMVGSSTYIAGALYSVSLGSVNLQQKILCIMVCLWATRLGIYLVHRFHIVGKDKRFDDVRCKPLMFFVYWSLQGVWIAVTLLPTVLVNLQALPSRTLSLPEFAGMLVWLIGFSIEFIADYQKTLFRAECNGSQTFIKTGLWKHCRHPNYFGEILLWGGVALFCIPSLQGASLLACGASPLFVFFLLSHMSGVPILEKAADGKWGSTPAYQAYKSSSRTLLLLPWKP